MRSEFSTVVHILPLALLLLACSSGERDGSGSPTADSARFRVALLTPGPISDQAWNAGAYQGLLRIRDSMGAQISHIETRTPADFEENFRQYGAQGYDLVFGHGFEFQDPASRVGPGYPNTVYITSSGNRVGRNVAPMVFGFDDGSYLAGVLAGSLTRGNVIGAIGGTELPPVKSGFLAYEAGARSVNPRVRVLVSYVGNWEDASAGKEQALAQIQRGADFIFQNADAAGLGIIQAAKESRDVYVFGANADQNAVAPDVIIGSVVIDLPHAFLSVAREVRERRFTPRVIYLGMQSDVVSLTLNPALERLIAAELRASLDSVQRGIIDGTIRPPRIEFVDTTRTAAR
ncbi:MAG TPA: BMP family protein [Gemmatimonadaceae bacterium]|nr:BMP family protein [Gemmatimonadaceae bacterium]